MMRSFRWALIQYDYCPYKRGNFDTDIHIQGEGHVNMKMANYKPRKEVWNRSSPQKEPTLLIPWSQTSGSQTYETINFCLSCIVCGTLYRSPNRLLHLCSHGELKLRQWVHSILVAVTIQRQRENQRISLLKHHLLEVFPDSRYPSFRWNSLSFGSHYLLSHCCQSYRNTFACVRLYVYHF